MAKSTAQNNLENGEVSVPANEPAPVVNLTAQNSAAKTFPNGDPIPDWYEKNKDAAAIKEIESAHKGV